MSSPSLEEREVREVTYAGRVLPGGGKFIHISKPSMGALSSHKRVGSGGLGPKREHRRTRTLDNTEFMNKFGKEGIGGNLMSVDEQDELRQDRKGEDASLNFKNKRMVERQ